MSSNPGAGNRSPAKNTGASSVSGRSGPIPRGATPEAQQAPGEAAPAKSAVDSRSPGAPPGARSERRGTPPTAASRLFVDPVLLARPMRRLRSRMPWLFRRGWALVIVTLLVTSAAVGVSGLKSASYSSDAILLVNPGATKTSPGSSQEAQALAATYAGLIPSDNAVLSAVSAATGLTEAQVKNGTTVTVLNGTSLLDLRFSTTLPSTATVGVTAMSRAISGERPATSAIPAGTMTVIHGASTPVSHARKLVEVVVLGLMLGLVLGAVIVIIWDRADARFDRPGQVTGQLGIPARSLQHLNTDAATAMTERWRSLAMIDEPTIALLSGVVGMQDSTEIVGRRLARVAPNAHLRTGGAPGDENGDGIAQMANLTILLIPREARVRAVLRSVDFLGQIGVRPAWALMVDESLL
jgi:capsular polysaccharide biosynthesis protein